MPACSVMAQCLRAGEDEAAGDALSSSLLLAGAFGTLFLIVLLVPLLPLLMHQHA